MIDPGSPAFEAVELSALGGDYDVARMRSEDIRFHSDLRALLHELEHSVAIQNEDFENLVRSSQNAMESVLPHALELVSRDA